MRVSLPLVDHAPSASWHDVARSGPHAVPHDAAGSLHFRDGPGSEATGEALSRVLHALGRYRIGGEPIVFSLAGMPAGAIARLGEALGEGEVAIAVTGRHVIHARETALAGLWRVDEVDAAGRALASFLEVADVPLCVRAADREATRADLSIGPPPPGAMSSSSVLAELRHHMHAWQPGEPNHVVSLSMMPMGERDRDHLEEQIGHGPVVAESSGYGPCRVELTAHRHIWSLRYMYPNGSVLLETVEVGDVPSALTAATDDFEDSAAQLAELLGV